MAEIAPPTGSDQPPRAGLSRWPQPSPDRPEVVYDLDHAFHELYDTAVVATQMRERAMRRQRHYLIPQVLRRVRSIPGDAAEVGCYRGLSAYLACGTLNTLGRGDVFHIFDSFEGLSSPTAADQSAHLPAAKDNVPSPFACAEDQVRANLAPFAFIEYHKGWVPHRFADVADRRFAYVHVDVDLYEPTRDTIAFFWPRLSPGGAMLLDDYATLFYPGARKAADEILASYSDAFILETPAGSAAAIKLGG